MQDEYGSRKVPDERWLDDAGRRGWVVVTKDQAIRRRPAERRAFLRAKARVVCLTTGDVTPADNVEFLRANLARLAEWWDKPGPWLLIVQKNRVEQVVLEPERS